MVHFPSEIIAGMGPDDLTEEARLKAAYARSGVDVVADVLTAEHLRPMLEAHSVPNPEEYRFEWSPPPENATPISDLWCSPTENIQSILDAGMGPRFLNGWWTTPGVLDGRYRQRQRNRRRRRRG
jgi:hypothetical protein